MRDREQFRAPGMAADRFGDKAKGRDGVRGDQTGNAVPMDIRDSLSTRPSGGGVDRLGTSVVHAGEDLSAPVRPLSDPIARSTVFAFDDPTEADRMRTADPPEAAYGRDGLPNVRALERAVAELEGAQDAYAVASGMAAISLTFLAHLAAGERIVLSEDCYCETSSLAQDELSRFGVVASYVDMTDLAAVEAAMEPAPRLLYVETISNPAMKLPDLPRLADLAHAVGALLCVDNTFATPLLCRPLEHGADLVVHSATKFLGGHHDLMAGVVAGSAQVIAPIRRSGYLFGPTLGPTDAWLALRGIRTLAARMAWICSAAETVARFLAGHPAVASVRYPGLADGAQAALAARLLPDGTGGMIAFDLTGGASAAEAVIRALRLIPFAPSLGGPTTTVCYPPREISKTSTVPSFGSTTLRLSIGLEAGKDIVADLKQALDGVLRECP